MVIEITNERSYNITIDFLRDCGYIWQDDTTKENPTWQEIKSKLPNATKTVCIYCFWNCYTKHQELSYQSKNFYKKMFGKNYKTLLV